MNSTSMIINDFNVLQTGRTDWRLAGVPVRLDSDAQKEQGVQPRPLNGKKTVSVVRALFVSPPQSTIPARTFS